MLTHWWKDFVAAVVVAGGVSAVLGVAVHDLRTDTAPEREAKALAALPRTDAAAARLDRIATEIRSSLYDEVRAFDWTLLVPPTLGPCPRSTAARIVNGGTWAGDPIPPGRWPATFEDLRRALLHNGFTAVDVRLGDRGEQHLSVDDSEGTTLEFSLRPTSTTFSLETGCRLPPTP